MTELTEVKRKLRKRVIGRACTNSNKVGLQPPVLQTPQIMCRCFITLAAPLTLAPSSFWHLQLPLNGQASECLMSLQARNPTIGYWRENFDTPSTYYVHYQGLVGSKTHLVSLKSWKALQVPQIPEFCSNFLIDLSSREDNIYELAEKKSRTSKLTVTSVLPKSKQTQHGWDVWSKAYVTHKVCDILRNILNPGFNMEHIADTGTDMDRDTTQELHY